MAVQNSLNNRGTTQPANSNNTTLATTAYVDGAVPSYTTVGENIAEFPNPSAVTFLRVNADNSVSALTAAQLREAIGIRWAQVSGSDYTTTSATESVVTGLSLSVEANAKYRGSVVLHVGCNNSGGIRVGFNFPASSSFAAGITGSTSGPTAQSLLASNAFSSGVSGSTAYNTNNSAIGFVLLDFYIETGVTAGDVELIARAGTAGQTCTVFAGISTMKLERIDA